MNAYIKLCCLIILTFLSFGKFAIAQVDIAAMEYFVDIDPGIGAGTPIPITGGPRLNVSESLVIPTSTLSVGFHTLYIRVQDINSLWSVSESRSFYVAASNLNTQSNIVAIEYFIDSDPGYGSGTSIPVTATTNVNISATIITSTLSAGYHVLYLRSLDQDGIWGEIESRQFFIDGFASGKIAGIEYFINTDPGYGSGTNLAILPVKDSIDSVINIPTVPLTAGTHVLGMRIITDKGTYGMTDYFNFTLCDGATASFSSDIVCNGAATLFTDLSTNVLAGDVYSWDFDNDGLEDSNTAGDQSFIYPTAGIYTAKLSIDRAGCISVDSVQVNVETLPVAYAGADQDICTTNTTLASNPAGTNEVGVWSLFTGSAVITDPADSLSTLTAITTDSVSLIWRLTNTVGVCTDEDTVLITANLPITAAILEDSVDIGAVLNFDVQSVASINPGDTLLTSITTMPLYGIASVLTDGTIEYTPDLDANSSDSLVYRITNQCTNFAENQIIMNVANAPPLIDNNPVTIPKGATSVDVDLITLISDTNGNVDFSTLTVATQPISGALASIDGSYTLNIDYTGITFTGNDSLAIRVCDLVSACAVQTIIIANVEVGGDNPPLRVFNGVSPNGDGYNDFLEIENIEFYPDNRVLILNRWGDKIAEYHGYNNQDIVFKDASLPTGTYYYHIIPNIAGVNKVTGHFLLKID